mmetsp:Transcript_29480/g.66551  ORF Transcript_29480/g.66551 Transcript_29480/m.66551 type:complete len:277 (-) Transcript_29480:113-943(-)
MKFTIIFHLVIDRCNVLIPTRLVSLHRNPKSKSPANKKRRRLQLGHERRRCSQHAHVLFPDDPVYEPVLHRLVGLQVFDPLAVLHDDTERLPGRLRDELARRLPVVRHLPRPDGDVRRLTLPLRPRLVELDRRVGERGPAPLLALAQYHSGRAEGLPYGHRVDRRADVLHDVRDGERLGLEPYRLARRRRGAAGVDVHRHRLVLVLVVQVQQLRYYELRHGGHERHADVNYSVVQQERRKVGRRPDVSTALHVVRRRRTASPGHAHLPQVVQHPRP